MLDSNPAFGTGNPGFGNCASHGNAGYTGNAGNVADTAFTNQNLSRNLAAMSFSGQPAPLSSSEYPAPMGNIGEPSFN